MLGYSAGVARGAKLPWSRAGSGSMLPTINRYDAAPRRQKQPATTRGMTNDPLVIVSMTPVNVVVTIPARLDAKFWIPPMEATWPGVGATARGSDQIAAAVNARLA